MEKDDLIAVFSNLETNDKRNSYNEEILKIYELLKSAFNFSGNNPNFTLHNYDSNKEENISEDEFLINEYRNVLMLREMIINCMILKK